MSFFEELKLSILLMVREKKKIFYVLLIFLISILSLLILNFNDNVGELMLKYLNNNIGFRTVNVMQRSNYVENSGEESLLKDVNEIANMEHVIDVYQSDYREVVIRKSDFESDKLDGTITLKRAVEQTLPAIKTGKKIENEGVMVCPIAFYPNYNPLEIYKDNIINGNDLLNNKYKVYFYNYVLDENKRPIENELLSYEFEVIGLYDNTETLDDNGVCYIPAEDLKKIIDAQKLENEKNSNISIDYSIDVVVDDINNVTNVENELENNGFEVLGTISTFDIQTINIIRIVIIFVLFISISSSFIISSLYIRKKMINEQKTIAILKTSGYLKKNIITIYVMQTLILNLIIYLLSIILFNISFYIIINRIPLLIGIDLLMGKIKLRCLPYIISFVIVVIIPSIITLFGIKKMYKYDISKLSKGDK
ncbi:MAG: FtsX-like permease family protein [Bacilli bacterium]|nr:FtsX-like permease family protein [Bacilli bacterium]